MLCYTGYDEKTKETFVCFANHARNQGYFFVLQQVHRHDVRIQVNLEGDFKRKFEVSIDDLDEDLIRQCSSGIQNIMGLNGGAYLSKMKFNKDK